MSEQSETDLVLGVPLVIITGLSGAGKSTAMQFLEDVGCFCVDNLPPALVTTFFELYQRTDPERKGVVIASDVRSGALFDDFTRMVHDLAQRGIEVEILYLDCDTATLMNRFNEVRRDHPLQAGGSMERAIENERQKLTSIRSVATHIIDTSNLAASGLRQMLIRGLMGEEDAKVVKLTVVSFGFKYGILKDADFVFDVRFLPNPYYLPELREKTGIDREVYDYVMSQPPSEQFFERVSALIESTLHSFVQVGKLRLTIGVGCTGGRHRSVAFARRLADHFNAGGTKTRLQHRDRNKALA